MRVVFDAEYDSLNPTKVWCVVAKDIQNGKRYVFRTCEEKGREDFRGFSDGVSCWIGANSIVFDAFHINRLLPGVRLPMEYPEHVDLTVISRLILYNRAGGHSVENYGTLFGHPKPEIEVYDDPDLIEDYIHRCSEDVEITNEMYKLYEKYITDPKWQSAIKCEHDTILICKAIKDRGFAFDADKARKILGQIEADMANLEKQIIKDVGVVIKPGKEKVLRKKSDGSPFAKVVEWFPDYPISFSDGATFSTLEYKTFNPGSVKERIEFLWKCGWNPIDKTKGHSLELRKRPPDKDKMERYKFYGWKVNEENLSTLPKDAPRGARLLAEWLTLEGRRGDLAEWLGAYRESTGAVHPTLFHIGSWTHRKSHSNPNCANIFSSFSERDIKDKDKPTGVEIAKLKYNNVARSCWTSRKDHLLVGTDAEGIQLRILAHAMEDKDYAMAVAEGKKEDESDVHNVNRRALGLEHVTRDNAKTFIYAWLLGAAVGKVKEILKCSTKQAQGAVRNFLVRLPALGRLKLERVPFYAERGFFDGLDGRKVACSSEHLMLAGILQNGESVVMKHANILWRKWADEEGIPYWQVNDVHDEWQTEVPIVSRLHVGEDGTPYTEEALRLGLLQRRSIEEVGKRLGVLTPLAGSTKIGWNWYETH